MTNNDSSINRILHYVRNLERNLSTKLSRSASLMGFSKLVKTLGADPESLLELAGIERVYLESDDYLLPSYKLVTLLEKTAEALNCPDFGIRLAKQQSLSMLGPIGLLVQQCETLGDAIMQLKRYLYVHSQAGVLNITKEHTSTYITFLPLVDYQGKSRQLIDLSLVAGLNILNEVVGRQLTLQSAFFSYREPGNLDAYKAAFNCMLTFGRELSGVSVSNDLLEWPLHSEKKRLKQFIHHYIQHIEHSNPMQLEDRLRVLIRQLLPLGQCNIQQLSVLLQVDVRTLQRRLKEKNTSYQTILADERKTMAIRYLTESDVSMSHLADLLGFAELSVFSRSFKSWVGMTPTQYLKQASHRLTYR